MTIIDEGASTFIISTTCWKEISSPTLNQSPNTSEAFDGCDLKPFSVLPNLSITLDSKTIHIEVDIIDANLNYNLLLRWSWTHSMDDVATSLFHLIRFPHRGKIVTVNQLSLFGSSS